MSFIKFYADNFTEVLRLSKDGIWANPDVPADEAAKLVLAAIDEQIKVLVEKAVADERQRLQAFMRQMYDAYTLSSLPGQLKERDT